MAQRRSASNRLWHFTLIVSTGKQNGWSFAVASGEFAKEYDPDHWDRAFLPSDLFEQQGPLVAILNEGPFEPVARAHVYAFSGRSPFLVFVRLPGGRKATLDYFQTLWNFPEPWVQRRDVRLPDVSDQTMENPDLPQFPAGTQVALVRQMTLFDNHGNLAPAPITESVQIRVYRAIPPRHRDIHEEQDFYEVRFSRPLLFARRAGGLRAIGPDGREFPIFQAHGPDEFAASPDQYAPLESSAPIVTLNRESTRLIAAASCLDRISYSSTRRWTTRLAGGRTMGRRIRGEAQNWNLKRVNVGPVALQRETPKLFLTSGTAILRHAVQDAWRRLIRPAQLNGIVFFLDDLQNLNTPSQHAVALALRDQFQWFAIENINCSICFSASANYFSNIRSLAEPAVRFYDKVYLGPFSVHETVEYVKAIFETATNCADFAQWLHSKTAGHPYFMAFICRQYQRLAHARDKLDAAEHWDEIFRRLGKEKFSADLAQVTEREVQLLRASARCEEQEINRKEFADYARIYFTRLTDKGLLIRTGRGHYRLYHPLFREFLRQTQ